MQDAIPSSPSQKPGPLRKKRIRVGLSHAFKGDAAFEDLRFQAARNLFFYTFALRSTDSYSASDSAKTRDRYSVEKK